MSKTKNTQRKFRANKARSCQMCKPYKNGRETKRTVSEQRRMIGVDQQLSETEK